MHINRGTRLQKPVVFTFLLPNFPGSMLPDVVVWEWDQHFCSLGLLLAPTLTNMN